MAGRLDHWGFMVNNMTMKKVNVFEVKARLSEFLDLVEKGEQVVICRRNRPVAELRAVASPRSTERPLGGTRLDLPPAFFEALPADLEDAFYGGPVAGTATAKVAEASTRYGSSRAKRRKKP